MADTDIGHSNTTRATARERISDNIDSLRERAAEAGEAGRQALEDHPGIAVAVAATVGAVAAGVIPTSRREAEALRPVAKKARAAIRKAVDTAKASGLQHIDQMGLTSAAISSGVVGLVGAVLKANKATSEPVAPHVASPTEPIRETETA
jgi:hypothetical protein